MEALNKIAAYVQGLDPRNFQKYLAITLASVALACGLLIFYLNSKNSELITRIKQLRTLSEKSFRIIQENREMVKEELRWKEKLDKEQNFTMQGFFEQFCKEQSITPEQGWNVRTESVSEKFDEISLPATFKDQTTEQLVKILAALEKKEIVYIKELVIRAQSPGKISFDITLATKKYKSLTE